MCPSGKAPSRVERCPVAAALTDRHPLHRQWSSVSALDRLPALVDVTLRNNPVTAVEKPETTRELIIARVSRLQVTRNERTDEGGRMAGRDGVQYRVYGIQGLGRCPCEIRQCDAERLCR